jgi:hypothetical protein
MDVLIPLHETCDFIARCPEKNRIRVLTDMPVANDHNEVYLHLSTETHGDQLDLQMDKNGATVLLAHAFHYAQREMDADIPLVNAEEYTKRGAEIARSLHFGSPLEYLAAWMNEDRKQAEIMRDLDALLSLGILEKSPQWMRHDILKILESETMKQIFARRFFDESKANPMDKGLSFTLKKPLQHNAEDKTDPAVSNLMTDVFQGKITYSGGAARFIEDAQNRMKSFHVICSG